MRFTRAISMMLGLALLVPPTVILSTAAYAQETTGGLQGTVKDPSGAVIPKAKVTLSSPTLVGNKEYLTDSTGHYRFANLPPGDYSVIFSAAGFKTYKLDGIAIGVGHLPTEDVSLQVGAEATTVEVTSSAPVIDTTTTQNIVNVDSEALKSLPTGTTFQSVIQFAPMARNEPLAGSAGGTGGSMPGSSGNGLTVGYSIGGAADSESSYLVEGQDTENISSGYSKANVPMDFIQEVEVKTSGVSSEYGGALGGVINVVMHKGGNQFHGAIFSSYESSGLDANPTNPYLRYDPTSIGNSITDQASQIYSPSKDHYRMAEPGVTVGGPIIKNKLVFFAGFEPLVNTHAKNVNFGTNDGNAGLQYFTQDRQTYFGTARLDATLTQKIRVFGSWLYQYARETGDQLPTSDPVASQSTYLNTAIGSPLTAYSHGLGWSAPNATYNTGADISITQHLVSTTRFGYFFDNYHDFGWPTSGADLTWAYNGIGATDNSTIPQPLPAALQQSGGTSTTPFLQSYTQLNSDKH